MSWRWVFILAVLILGASAAGGVAVGDWLVAQAPAISADGKTNTTKPPAIVLDAAGRPLAGLAPQPLIDGSLGIPQTQIQPMWEIETVSLFETNLDPMVVLSRGDETYSVSDMLTQAGAGLAQGPSDIAMVDVTGSNTDATPVATPQAPPANRTQDKGWQELLAEAIKACDNVGFFSRPSCVERAQKKFCEPNRAWGRHALCPAPFVNVPS